MRRSEAQAARSIKKREAKAKFLALVAEGVPSLKACKAIGRDPKTYYDWRREDPDWAARVTAARLGTADPTLAGMDFVKFRQLFFDRATPAHHYRMIEAIEAALPDSVTLVLGFPGCAKSSLLVDRICYKLAYDPNYRMAVISEGRDLARKLIGQVAMRMTDEFQFRGFIDRFGPFKAPDREQAKPWNADYFVLLQSHHDEKEPSLESRGVGSTLYGGRYDELDLDDIQSDGNLNATAGLLRYIRQTVLTRPAKGTGRVGIWGSRVGQDDIYAKLMDEEIVNNVVTIPALTEWVDRDDHFSVIKNKVVCNPELSNELSAWPDYWSVADLAVRRKNVGEEIWTRTYMQRGVVDAASAFTAAMVDKAKDHTRPIGKGSFGMGTMCSVDPAFDTGICAFMAASWSPENLWLLDAAERTDIFRTEDILAQIALWSAIYKPNVWIVEENNFQRGLVTDERLQEMARKFGFDVISHRTNRNKNDPIIGVAMMATAFANDEVRIPWLGDDAQARFGRLCEQLLKWRPRRSKDITQDLVMAMWFLWSRWEIVRQVPSGHVTKLWRPSWVGRAG